MKKLNRGWVKNAVIIFLLVALALTFFSNHILNFTLEEVEVERPTSGTITNALRGTGTVESLGSYSIEVDSVRQILAVYVREGDEVTQGMPLFLLEEGENSLLDELNALRLRYQSMLLELSGPDYAAQNESIRQAREDLQRAQAERAALGNAEMTETAAQRLVDEATATLTSRQNRLDQLELELTYIDGFDSRSSYIGTQVVAYEQALANFVQNVGMTYDDWVAANPGASNQWSLAVEAAETAMRNAAATQRVVVVQAISTQAGLVTTAQNALTTAQNTLARIGRIAAADDAVRNAQRALNAALIALSSQQTQDNIAHSQRMLELNALADEITDLEDRIRRQEGGLEGGDTTITARYDGVIVGLTAVAGQSASPGIPLARIEVAQMGYVAEFSADARQVQEVRPGIAAEVNSLNWFANLVGRVTSVRPDPDNPAGQRIIAVEIEGEIFAGEQVQISIPLSSARYETIVPRSAVQQDAQGYHVFLLESRSSPLGTRFTARRVDVTVEAQDDTRAAIRGDLTNWSDIIIRSSGPLADRDSVRLAN
ncbi:MAG: HlyD family efflux transporter periplasmic adaptor subunit [Oscillospiraceae bacterium]|nr:HlyD family efflux transporter periplasmic adaptor subunit [Oscillospiraceae bacterium]